MSTPQGWQTPKTNWQSPDPVGVSDLNRIEGNIQELQNTKETPSDAQAKVNTHANTKATLAQLGHVNHSVLTTTLNTTWTGAEAPFTKVQTVTGLLATDTPIVDVVLSGDWGVDEARLEAWGYIYRIVTSNDSITAYAREKPAVSLPIQLEVVR